MNNEKLTYKDFKIGQKVICVKINESDNLCGDYWQQHLTVGKTYKIDDVDFHFSDKIAIRSDNNKVTMFMPIELFCDNRYVRKLKLEKINRINA